MQYTNWELCLQTHIAVSFDKPFLRYTVYLSKNSFIIWDTLWGCFVLEIQLDRYGQRHASVWTLRVCIYISIYGNQLRLTKKSRTITNDGLQTFNRFTRKKFSYSTRCSLFLIDCLSYYYNYSICIYYRTSLRIRCQTDKKRTYI